MFYKARFSSCANNLFQRSYLLSRLQSMGLDINSFRVDRGGNPDVIRNSEIKRGKDGTIVDQLIAVDDEWRTSCFNMEQAKKELNSLNKEIGDIMKSLRVKPDGVNNLETEVLIKKREVLKKSVPELENRTDELDAKRKTLLSSVGNIVAQDVFVSCNELHNPVLKTFGSIRINNSDTNLRDQKILHHHEILSKLGGFNQQKGVDVAGHRAYYLTGPGVMLNMALINYGIAFLVRKGYVPVQPPFFMRRDVMAECAELKDFNETLYRIPYVRSDESADTAKEPDKDDLFLIATAEQPLCALHRDETVSPSDLPLKYAGFSSCFRKEAGSHGKDTWGIFRVHQFEKVEQFVLCTEEKSEKIHEEMLETAEEFYQSLQLPYRIVSIVSGALNDAAAKKYDLEAWFPGYNEYRELVSCSNCTDYQSRSLGVRLQTSTKTENHPVQYGRPTPYVHMLNGTLVATQRCMCCILENYQTPEGVKVPSVLVPFMGGVEFLYYK